MTKILKEHGSEAIIEAKSALKISVQGLLTKVKMLISKLNQIQNENWELKEQNKTLDQKVNELKLALTQTNTESLSKDKTISDLKNNLLNEKSGSVSVQDKEVVRSRIKELISRIDVHLDQIDENQ